MTERAARRVEAGQLGGRVLCLDGYNVLTTVEVALGGGVILHARDGTFRDIASMHGTYRKVAETVPALELIGRMVSSLSASTWIWYLDRPVSNSGRLRKIMVQLAAERGWPWQIELVPNPDEVLSPSAEVVVSADSVVLDRCRHWFNLAREVINQHVPCASVVPMADGD